ncbi:MAG: hypothetical protein ABSF59_22535 [Candidatus Sulfotelmatobacter sp.]|jgi:hypothetical protein
MAHRIADRHLEGQRETSPEALRQVFEAAVCDIYHADLAPKKPRYRTPIAQRKGFLGVSKDGAEKRALADAARALAQLWKV